jgi:hypothetical protein
MITWDYPIVILGALAVAVAVGWLLIRVSVPPRVGFNCLICGREDLGFSARQWRYCPYCGAPKGAASLADLPRRKRPKPLSRS